MSNTARVIMEPGKKVRVLVGDQDLVPISRPKEIRISIKPDEVSVELVMSLESLDIVATVLRTRGLREKAEK
jgi:hypothetical protein